jgi:alpha-beta hydrolase superfamily lysophospholipase
MQYEKFFVSEDGSEIFYVIHKNDTHDTLENPNVCVFVHGLTENVSTYKPLFEKFINEGTFDAVFAFDLDGHGKSHREFKDRTHIKSISSCSSSLNIFINYIVAQNCSKGAKITLMSHSLGGLITTHYMSKYENNIVDKVVMASPGLKPKAYCPSPLGTDLFLKYKFHLPFFMALMTSFFSVISKQGKQSFANSFMFKKQYDDCYASDWEDYSPLAYDSRSKKIIRVLQNVWKKNGEQKTFRNPTMYSIFSIFSASLFSGKWFKKISVPTLILHGEEDGFVDLEKLKVVAKTNKNAEIHEIEGLRHHCWFCNTDLTTASEVDKILLPFLNK